MRRNNLILAAIRDESVVARFWAKVERGPDCWEWLAGRNQHGYGTFHATDGVLAHRFAWALRHGEDPGTMRVCHACDNRGCVNPDHLFSGSQADNIQDMWSKGRGNPPLGERSSAAKLTAAKVRAIRWMYPTVSQTEIARRFGVSQPNVGYIVRGESWKHLL